MARLNGRRFSERRQHDIEHAMLEVAEHLLDRSAADIVANIGPALAKAAERRGYPRSGVIDRDTNPDGLPGFMPDGQMQNLVVYGQQAARVIDDDLAARRQADAGGALVEDLVPEQ